MQLIVQLGEISAAPPAVVRSLRGAPDFQPDWRFRLVEQYLVQIAKAKEESDALDAVLRQEGDRRAFATHIDRLVLRAAGLITIAVAKGRGLSRLLPFTFINTRNRELIFLTVAAPNFAKVTAVATRVE